MGSEAGPWPKKRFPFLDNIESQQFTRLCDDIHRIANKVASEENPNSDSTINGQLSAAYANVAYALEKILDSGVDLAVQRANLRELVTLWENMSDEYRARQKQLDSIRFHAEQKESQNP